MIKRNWIERYDELPPQQDRLIILQSWDTASKGGPENDFSVCTTWLVTRSRRWYLIDVWRKRVDYPELKAAVQRLAAKYKAKRVLVEDTGTGTSLVQELRRGKVSGIRRGEAGARQDAAGWRSSRRNSSLDRFSCLSARPGLLISNGSFSRSLAPDMTINAIPSARPYQSRITDFR